MKRIRINYLHTCVKLVLESIRRRILSGFREASSRLIDYQRMFASTNRIANHVVRLSQCAKTIRQLRSPECSAMLNSRRMSTAGDSDRNVISIGFIGLGSMGYPMAKNILKNYSALLENSNVSGNGKDSGKNSKVEVYLLDVAPGRAQQLIKEHSSNSPDVIVVEAKDVSHLASKCSIIITMLPNTSHVVDTMLGINSVFENAKKGAFLSNLLVILFIYFFFSKFRLILYHIISRHNRLRLFYHRSDHVKKTQSNSKRKTFNSIHGLSCKVPTYIEKRSV